MCVERCWEPDVDIPLLALCRWMKTSSFEPSYLKHWRLVIHAYLQQPDGCTFPVNSHYHRHAADFVISENGRQFTHFMFTFLPLSWNTIKLNSSEASGAVVFELSQSFSRKGVTLVANILSLYYSFPQHAAKALWLHLMSLRAMPGVVLPYLASMCHGIIHWWKIE